MLEILGGANAVIGEGGWRLEWPIEPCVAWFIICQPAEAVATTQQLGSRRQRGQRRRRLLMGRDRRHAPAGSVLCKKKKKKKQDDSGVSTWLYAILVKIIIII